MTSDGAHPDAFVQAYEQAFVQRCHEIVDIGYRRPDSKALANTHEPAITELLVDAMEAALDAPDAPSWTIHFTVLEDPPGSTGGNVGKHRSRIDITIRRINPRPSTNFRFEAKRLAEPASLGTYLGQAGMLASCRTKTVRHTIPA